MRDMTNYRKQLKKIAQINGLHLPHPMYEAPRAYVERLKERQTGTHRGRKVRKRKKMRSSVSTLSCTGSEDSKSSDQSSRQLRQFAEYSYPDPKHPRSDGKGSSSGAKVASPDAKVSAASSQDSACSRSVGKVSDVSADNRSTRVFASGSMCSLDEQCAQTSSGRWLGSPTGKERPHSANEPRKARLPPLSNCHSEKMDHTPSLKENMLQAKSTDGDLASSTIFRGLCGGVIDNSRSSSISQLSHSEDIESWLLTITPSSSPSSVKSQDLPPINLKQINNSQVLNLQCLHALASSDTNLDTCPPPHPPISPPSSCHAKRQKSAVPIRRSRVTHK